MESERQPNPIAALNDTFRQQFNDWYSTQGALALPDHPGLLLAVRDYNDFNPDNDPYGEHDFGSLMWQEQKVFWKIDYYDQALQYGLDALDPECRRVLTIMLASEY